MKSMGGAMLDQKQEIMVRNGWLAAAATATSSFVGIVGAAVWNDLEQWRFPSIAWLFEKGSLQIFIAWGLPFGVVALVPTLIMMFALPHRQREVITWCCIATAIVTCLFTRLVFEAWAAC